MSQAIAMGRIPEITLPMRLRIARESAGLEQTDLSKISGLSRATISSSENGHRRPSRATITLFAMACGVDRDWLENGFTNGNDPRPDGAEVSWLPRLDSNQQPSD